MTDNTLAVLKSLTIRPSQAVAREIEPVLVELQKAGFATRSASGWIATAEGCNLIEQKKASVRHRQ